MDKASSCRPPKPPDEWQSWWDSLSISQKIAEFEVWLTCSCSACSLFREIVGEERLRNAIEKFKTQAAD